MAPTPLDPTRPKKTPLRPTDASREVKLDGKEKQVELDQTERLFPLSSLIKNNKSASCPTPQSVTREGQLGKNPYPPRAASYLSLLVSEGTTGAVAYLIVTVGVRSLG